MGTNVLTVLSATALLVEYGIDATRTAAAIPQFCSSSRLSRSSCKDTKPVFLAFSCSTLDPSSPANANTGNDSTKQAQRFIKFTSPQMLQIYLLFDAMITNV